MDVIKRILGLTNCHDHKPIGYMPHIPTNGNIIYLGHNEATQPDPGELQRAMHCLYTRNRPRTSSAVSRPLTFSFDEEAMTGVEEDDPTNILEFTMHKIVLSCVDAKNQRILALFYHNPESRQEVYKNGLECHLFLCKSKEVARRFAERISEALTISYRIRRRQNGVVLEQAPAKTLSKYVSYENVEFKPETSAGSSTCVSEHASAVYASKQTTCSKTRLTEDITISEKDKGILRRSDDLSEKLEAKLGICNNNNTETWSEPSDLSACCTTEKLENTEKDEPDEGKLILTDEDGSFNNVDVDIDELTRLIDLNETNI